MAASRLLGGAAACLILLSFAAGHGASYWSGCIKAVIAIFQQNFSILTLAIFLLESASKSSFIALSSRSGFGAAISDAAACSSCVLQRSLCKSHRD